jgi:hypothetical protein
MTISPRLILPKNRNSILEANLVAKSRSSTTEYFESDGTTSNTRAPQSRLAPRAKRSLSANFQPLPQKFSIEQAKKRLAWGNMFVLQGYGHLFRGPNSDKQPDTHHINAFKMMRIR